MKIQYSLPTKVTPKQVPGQASNSAATMCGIAVACWYLPIFLQCGAVLVMEIEGNIAPLINRLFHIILTHARVAVSATFALVGWGGWVEMGVKMTTPLN